MRRFRTLRGRLTAVASLAAALAVVIVVVLFNVLLAKNLNGEVDSRLRAQAAAAATTVNTSGGRLAVRESPDDEAIDAQVWVFDGRRVVVRPHGPPELQQAAAMLAGRSRRFVTLSHPEVRLYALPITRGGRQVGTVVAGESLAPYDRTTDLALIGTVVLGGILLLAVYGLTWLTIGRALGPVSEMTRSAATWGEHDVGRRFGAATRPDELGELAATFDTLLDRLASSLRHEQRLSAELSHELRTPLARILAQMELLQRRERPPEERAEAYEVVARSAEQMSRILETLMAAARAEAEPGRARCELAEPLEDLQDTWADVLGGRGVALSVQRPEGRLEAGVEADIVERVVAPLLDNAGRFARSAVTVTAARSGGRVLLTVHDDGPGVAPDEREAIFEPGVRGAGSDGHAGAGLGLALARRLARAVGGDVRAGDNGGTGAAFVVELPG